MGVLIEFLSGELMTLQAVFNTQATKISVIRTASAFV